MKKQILLLLTAILFTGIIKAQDNEIVEKNYKLEPFTGIDAGDVSIIYISNGENYTAKVETSEPNEEASLTVKDGVLKISSGSVSNFSNTKIFITCPKLNLIKINGVSKIKSINTISTDNLTIKAGGASKVDISVIANIIKSNVSGAAKLNISGQANYHYINMSGAANINAKELVTSTTEIEGSGVSKADVNAIDELSGNIGSMSKVTYTREPKKNNIDNSSFSIIEMSDTNVVKIKNNNIKKGKANADTTRINLFGNEIEVIEGKETKINFGENEMKVDEDGNVKFAKSDKKKPYNHKFKGHWAGFELAFNGYLNNDFGTELPSQYEFLQFNDVKSIGVNLNLFELNGNIIKNRFGVVSGLGIQWNNYRFDDNVVLLPDSGRIYGYHNTSINSYIKSKLVETWVRVPVFLEYQTAQKKSKQFHVAVGGVFGYKLCSHSKQVHFEGGDRNKDKIYDDFYLNPIKVDAEVRIGWGLLNLFASYSLTTMFKENKGPELYPYMVGITLAGW
jgi:hypothetical protein